MGGLAKVCRLYGSINITDTCGHKVTWVWDYDREEARLKSSMTDEEIAKSEKMKYEKLKESLKWK